MGESHITRKVIGGTPNYGNYSSWAVQDENGVKYETYNGYDFETNPNVGNNLSFNQWAINNSTTKNIVLTNTIMSSFLYNTSTLYQGAPILINTTGNITTNIMYTSPYGFTYINNSFYGVISNGGTSKIYAFNNNLSVTNQLNLVGGPIRAVSFGYSYSVPIMASTPNINGGGNFVMSYALNSFTNRGFSFNYQNDVITTYIDGNIATGGSIFVGGYSFPYGVVRISATGGGYAGATPSNYGNAYWAGISGYPQYPAKFYAGLIYSITTNNGNIFFGGQAYTGNNQPIEKYSASSLSFLARSVDHNDGSSPSIRKLIVKNNFVYALIGSSNRRIGKLHESNLVYVGNINLTPITNDASDMLITDDYIYVADRTSFVFHRIHLNNLTYIDNSPVYNNFTIGRIPSYPVLFNNTIYGLDINTSDYNNFTIPRFKTLVSEKNTAYKIESVKEE
jgi:hypothetical protein